MLLSLLCPPQGKPAVSTTSALHCSKGGVCTVYRVSNPGSERQIAYVLSHLWILASLRCVSAGESKQRKVRTLGKVCEPEEERVGRKTQKRGLVKARGQGGEGK